MENRHFRVIAAGDNAEENMLKYDIELKVAPYVVFEYAKAEQYRKDYMKTLKNIIAYEESNPKREERDEARIQYLKDELKEIKEENATDYYLDLTDGFELDEKTGNALSTENPNWKYTSHKLGGDFSLPFILKDGTETYKARKDEIDWDKIHLANTRAYEVAWDTTHGLAEPQDEDERTIYEHMKNMHEYFSNFEGREHYIAANTAFWGLAFVDDNGWHELDESVKQFDWVIGFYDEFIKPLPENTLLTIYECVRPKQD